MAVGDPERSRPRPLGRRPFLLMLVVLAGVVGVLVVVDERSRTGIEDGDAARAEPTTERSTSTSRRSMPPVTTAGSGMAFEPTMPLAPGLRLE